MTPTLLTAADISDTELVQQSLAGDRQAFGRIVTRYQSVVCALAYSATGSRSRSEDLAQDTFLAAWRSLRDLREPGRLRSWLCGIARITIHGDRRRLGRQPVHEAAALDDTLELPSAEPSPTAQAVKAEEMAILWREVGRLPDIYREPLILFYREHQSVEHVAEALELSPDAVMQRLTRGRRQLTERMLDFVESTLERTNPGPQFALHVEAALPILASSGPAAALGAAAKGGGAATKGSVLGFLLAWLAPLVGVFAAISITWTEITQARTPRERRFVARWMLAIWLSVAAMVIAMGGASRLAWSTNRDHPEGDWTTTAPLVAVWFGFTMVAVTLIVLMIRGKAALRRQIPAEALTPPTVAVPMSMAKRIANTAGFLISLFWILVFLAWRTDDRLVAGGIAGGVFLLGAVTLWLGCRQTKPVDEEKTGGWFVALCGLVFLGILNWRLDVWVAPLYRSDLATVHRMLPMSIVHCLSAIVIAWTAALVFVTKPDEKP